MVRQVTGQSALQAMDVYFSAKEKPEQLRVNGSGDVEIAGRFTLLFDRVTDRVKSLVIAGYHPVDWRKRADDAVRSRLQQSLAALLPGSDSSHVQLAAKRLLANICHQLSKSDKISWRQALVMELDQMCSSSEGSAISNAIRLLAEIERTGHPELERQAMAVIGEQSIDFALLTNEGRQARLETLSQTIARYLQDRYALPEGASAFGAEALLRTMQDYHLDLDHARRLLGVPASLRDTGTAVVTDQFILNGIARTIVRHTGAPPEAASKAAKNVEFCMRRYAIDWKQALDLVGLTNRLVEWLGGMREARQRKAAQAAQTRPDKRSLGTAEMDCARAVQQVMARDGCDAEAAMRVVERRLVKLERIRTALPPQLRPSIVDGMQFRIDSPIKENSRHFLAEQISTLDAAQQRAYWRVPGKETSIPLSQTYLMDAKRSLRVALDDGRQPQYYDEHDAEKLTERIHEFAGDAQTMTAICDSINQTLQASIMVIILRREQVPDGSEQLSISPGEEPSGTATQRLWHSVTLDGEGRVIIRHLFMQKTGMIMATRPDPDWPINHGEAWRGDVNPLNAGLIYDFSYAFKLDDLRQGLRNPKILDCHYTITGSLDWNSIDRMED